MRKCVSFFCAFALVISALCVTAFAEEVNLAIYGRAMTDAVAEEACPVDYAIDGDPATRWASAELTEDFQREDGLTVKVPADGREGISIGVQFATAAEIDRAVILWETQYAAEAGYSLQYSQDGKEWEEVPGAEYTWGARADGGVEVEEGLPVTVEDTVTFDAVEAVYFRVFIRQGGTKHGLGSIYELELYGEESQREAIQMQQTISSQRPSSSAAAPVSSGMAAAPVTSVAAGSAVDTSMQLPEEPADQSLIIGLIIAIVALSVIVVVIVVAVKGTPGSPDDLEKIDQDSQHKD